jgi:hypothetical protein
VSGGEPVFLVGTTRSGTTLLRLMLDHHSQLSLPGEFEFAVELVADDGRFPSLDDYCDWLGTNRHFLYHALEIDSSLDYPGLVNDFLLQMRRSSGAEEKPIAGAVVHRHYERLLHLWPMASFIHIVRDPRDVCASWLRMGWVGSPWGGGREWRRAELQWDHLRASLPPTRRHELRFEDLIARPRESLESLCRFLTVPFEETMLDYSRDSTYEPVDPSQAEKWRKELSPASVQRVEAGAGDLLMQRGYPHSGFPELRPGALRHAFLSIEDRIGRIRGRLRTYGGRIWWEDVLARRIGSRAWHRRVQLRMHAVTNRRLK